MASIEQACRGGLRRVLHGQPAWAACHPLLEQGFKVVPVLSACAGHGDASSGQGEHRDLRTSESFSVTGPVHSDPGVTLLPVRAEEAPISPGADPPERSLENPRPAHFPESVTARARRNYAVKGWRGARRRCALGQLLVGGAKGSGKGNIIRVGGGPGDGAGGIEPASHTREVHHRVPARRILFPVSGYLVVSCRRSWRPIHVPSTSPPMCCHGEIHRLTAALVKSIATPTSPVSRDPRTRPS